MSLKKNGKKNIKNVKSSITEKLEKFRSKTREKYLDNFIFLRTSFHNWLRRKNSGVIAVVFILTSIIIAFISLPDSVTRQLPKEKSDIGNIMNFTVQANRNYTVIDEEKTSENRVKAKESVPSYFFVIDNDKYYSDIKDSFSLMRKKAKEFVRTEIEKKYPEMPEKIRDKAVSALWNKLLRGEKPEFHKKIVKYLSDRKTQFDRQTGIHLGRDIYSFLCAGIFSENMEKSLFSIISKLRDFNIYRKGLPENYSPANVMIRRGNAFLRISPYRIISETTLLIEINNMSKKITDVKKLSEEGKALVKAFVYTVIKDNLSPDRQLTEEKKLEAWNNAPRETISVKNGEIILRAGEEITERDVMIFKEMSKQDAKQSGWLIFFKNLLFFLISGFVIYISFNKSIRKFSICNKDALLMGFQAMAAFIFIDLIIATAVPLSTWMGDVDARIFYFLIPIPFIIASVRFLTNMETAVFFLILLVISFLVIFPDNYFFPVFYFISSFVYLYLVTHLEKRGAILKVSFLLSLVMSGMTIIIFAMDTTLQFNNLFRAIPLAFFNGMLSGILLVSTLPLWEWWLDYTTNITFLEFSALDHELMKRMAVEANGTYQHSLTVGSLVDNAAREVGMNPLACKVMAYFHDIGKLERPLYFSENQMGKNKHDELTPSMSTMIIHNHVRHGKKLASDYNLGDKIEEAVAQHHGTSVVTYFYEKAKETDGEADKNMFRYPGPEPESRETALIMLADSIEAAVRSMKVRNHKKIEDTIKRIISDKMDDGQLSRCNITLHDLEKIRKSFTHTLSGIYHARIEYPGQES